MKIEKVKNYNQRLLAILGTLVALLALVGLVFISYFTITEIRRDYRYSHEDGILSEEEIQELQKDSLRKQLITYSIPRLVDTMNSIYMIPIGHITLDNPEHIDEALLGLMDASFDMSEKDFRYSYDIYGSYNNILIYDSPAKDLKKLFDSRINFEHIEIEYFKDEIFILFKASKKDTFKDGVINLEDLKSLYIYCVNEGCLREIKKENADVYNYRFLNDRKDLFIQFGLDHNKNGKFEAYEEPAIVLKYDYSHSVLQDVVDSEITMELQKTLEGSSN